MAATIHHHNHNHSLSSSSTAIHPHNSNSSTSNSSRHKRIPSDPLNESIYNLALRPGGGLDDRPKLYKSKFANQIRAEHLASKRGITINGMSGINSGLLISSSGGLAGVSLVGVKSSKNKTSKTGSYLIFLNFIFLIKWHKIVDSTSHPNHPRVVQRTSTGLHITAPSNVSKHAKSKSLF